MPIPPARPRSTGSATLPFRRHLLGLGFGIAEAMDTSQRGMGLDWPSAHELIRRSLADCRARTPAASFPAVGTDQLDPANASSLDDVIAAYLEQLHAIQKLGGRIILMASRALAKVARSPDDYVTVYAPRARRGGQAGDPALAGRDVRSGARRLLGRQ